MTLVTAVALNAVLATAVVAGLALVVRLAHRFEAAKSTETLHPSQPLELAVVLGQDEPRRLAQAA